MATLANNAPVTVGNVTLEFRALINGRVQSVTRTVSSLSGGSGVTVGSGLVLPQGVIGTADNMQVRIVSATVP